ncbi:MAG: FAD:protein FMN transferase [Desulfopila sp.]|jgi:thiamine biosynthesis lipoprotein|nr:FAD:protein FMN transferase [Desulfopila sp.]
MILLKKGLRCCLVRFLTACATKHNAAGSRTCNSSFFVAASLLFSLLISGCNTHPEIQTMTGFAQGTVWNITLWGGHRTDMDVLRQAVDQEFSRLDLLLSGYRQDSVIERFNTARTTEAIEVGPEIVSLVEIAAQVSRSTQGSYDLTIGPLFELWGFKGNHLTPPPEEDLAQVMNRIGFNKLEIIPPDRLRKRLVDISIDLSSIAQGYSVSRLASIVEHSGIENYIVEIGGELQTRGRKPDGSPWRIGLERPVAEERSLHKVLTIEKRTPAAVMTSGTYRRYFDEQGKRYSHVLDARTGRPVEHSTVSVTVFHNDPTVADAWSTALLCLGVEEGAAVADKAGIAAMFISTQNGLLTELFSPAWTSSKGITVTKSL